MVRHLLRLSHPFSLTCLNVGCPGNAENLVSDTRNLQITELIVDRLRRPNMIRLATRLALGPRLSALKIEEHDSTELYPSFLHNPGHKFDSLRHLQVFQPVEEADMTNFLSFLASCPQLSHLRISHSYSSRPKPAFLLPPTSIPHLSFFDAPYGIARLLVHGRPVLSLKLRCAVKSDLQRETLSQLAEGSTPLRGLDVDHVEWRDDVLLDVAEYFPALQDLKLRVVKYDYCNLLLKRLDSDMKRLPSMQRFFTYNFTARRPEEDFGSDTLRLLEVTNDRLTSIGFRLKTERYRDERRWVLLPLSQI
ncbi:hypothetical protein FRB94_011079 [Tulasnella sp. JGI-2019a]|nr:hypothetical protein FRB94_011079 [Tulasnella sp. JGI-2019a]